MENAQTLEQIMQTPFTEAIQNAWVIGTALLLVCYAAGVFQCRRVAKQIMKQNFQRMFVSRENYLYDSDKWLIFFLLVASPVWAPIGLIGEGIGRGAHRLAIATVDRLIGVKS